MEKFYLRYFLTNSTTLGVNNNFSPKNISSAMKNLNRLLLMPLMVLMVLFGSGSVWGQSAGFNNTFIVLSLNGGANTYYDLNATTASTDFNGANLGSFAAGTNNLVFKGAEHNIYKCGGADLTSTRVYYRIYLTSAGASGSFTSNNITYTSGFNNGCGGQDQKWDKLDYSTNLLSGLAPGNYSIQVYSDASTTLGDRFASNGGLNYTASFTVSGNYYSKSTGNLELTSSWVTNTDGTISSQVSANTTSGFSVVTYTGNNTNGATVGHGLLVGGVATAPSMIIVKVRNAVARWVVYQKDVITANNEFLELDTTAKVDTSGTNFWTIASINNTTFGLGTNADTNGSTLTFVAYCFAPVAGYSAFGTYTGNGATDGTFVYTGFRPRFVMVKCSSNTTASTVWVIFDTSRSPYNAAVLELYPDSSTSEGTDSNGMDILSNGFKPKRNSEYLNFSGWTYIYMAFAESPFKYANAR